MVDTIMHSSSDTSIVQIIAIAHALGVSRDKSEPLTHSLHVKFMVDDIEAGSVALDKGAKSVEFLLERPFDLHSGSILVLRIREKHRLSALRDKTFPPVNLSLEKLGLGQNSQEGDGQFKSYQIRPKGCKKGIWLKFKLSRLPHRHTSNVFSFAIVKPSLENTLHQPEQNVDPLKVDVDEALEKLNEFGTILDRLGWGQYFLDTGLKFGAAVSQLNPIAGAVVGCLKHAYDKIKDQNRGHEKILTLAKSMARTVEHVRTVEKVVKLNKLKKTLDEFPCLMKETVELIKKLVGQGQFINLILSTPNDVKIDELRDRHATFMEEFDRGVKLDAAVKVDYLTDEGEMKELEKYLSKGTTTVEPVAVECIEGTRTAILADVVAKINGSDCANIIWIHGAPGSGKSSTSISTKSRMRREKRLITYFRFDRNQSSTTTTLALWQHVALCLARKFPPIRTQLLHKTRNDEVDLESAIDVFDLLVKGPLSSITEPYSDRSLVIVIDGLDECGGFLGRSSPDRQVLLQTLQRWSELPRNVAIKLLVTSRDEGDIHKLLSKPTISAHIHIRSGNTLTDDLTSQASKDASEDLCAFLKYRFKQTAERLSLGQDWPGSTMIADMTHRAAGNFMWAVTATTFVDANLNPNKGLEMIMGSASDLGDTNPLYSLYSTILESSLGTASNSDVEIIRVVLGTMVYAKRPLSDDEYMELPIPTPISPIVLRSIREGLGSIIVLDSDLRFVHKSFDDFLLSTHCPRKFAIDEGHIEYLLARLCISTMNSDSGLHFNMCNLETSCLKNVDVPDIDAKVMSGITRLLSYSCRFWADHLIRIPFNNEVMHDVTEMLLDKLLYWFEAMSLLNEMNRVSHALLAVLGWSKTSSDESFTDFIHDARRFIGTFIYPITQSAAHVYISALPFAPNLSLVAKRFLPQYPQTLTFSMGKQDNWSSCIFTSEHQNGPVRSIAFSPDEKLFVSGSDDGTVCICDSETGNLIAGPFQESQKPVLGTFVDPDGQRVWANHSGGQVIGWQIDKYGINKHLAFNSGHASASFSCGIFGNSQNIVSVGHHGGAVMLWSGDSGERIRDLLPIRNIDHYQVLKTPVLLSPDGRSLAWVRGDMSIAIRVSVGGSEIINKKSPGWIGFITAFSFSADGRYLVTAAVDSDIDGSIIVWDAKTAEPVGRPLTTGETWITAVAYSDSNKLIVSAAKDTAIVMVWNSLTHEAILGPLESYLSIINWITISRDGRRALSGSDDGTVRMWDLGRQVGSVTSCATDDSTRERICVAFSPCGQWLALLGPGETLRVRGVMTGEESISAIDTGIDSKYANIVFSPDGGHIVVYNGDILRIWDLNTGDPSFNQSFTDDAVVRLSFPPPVKLAFRSTDHRLITCSKYLVMRSWSFESGVLTEGTSIPNAWPTGYDSPAEIRALSPDGSTALVCHLLRTPSCFLWSTTTCQPLPLTFPGDDVTEIAFSSSGLFVTRSSGALQVWDIHTGGVIARRAGHDHDLRSPLGFSPDNHHIAYAKAASLFVWNMFTGDLVKFWNLHTTRIELLSFSPDGTKLVSITEDYQIRIWDTTDLVHGSKPSDGVLGVKVHMKDGWVMDDKDRLMFWVPKDHRGGLAGPRTTVVIGGSVIPTKLDFTKFRYGENWTECFDTGGR